MPTLDQTKARFTPGDPVHFHHRGHRLTGIITHFGPTRAAITLPDTTTYRVPYHQLHPHPTSKNHHLTEQSALTLCRDLLTHHGLPHWTARLDDTARRAAACHHQHHQISLSRLYLRDAPPLETRNTILHEIAHALAGHAHHHDAHWRAIAIDIGCDGTRCHTRTFTPPRWLIHCPNRCFPPVPRHRRPHGHTCRHCRTPIRITPCPHPPPP